LFLATTATDTEETTAKALRPLLGVPTGLDGNASKALCALPGITTSDQNENTAKANGEAVSGANLPVDD